MPTLQNRGRSMLTAMSSVVRLVAREIDGVIGVGGIENARDAVQERKDRQTDTFVSELTSDEIAPETKDIRAG